jgi:hypothetical protein
VRLFHLLDDRQHFLVWRQVDIRQLANQILDLGSDIDSTPLCNGCQPLLCFFAYLDVQSNAGLFLALSTNATPARIGFRVACLIDWRSFRILLCLKSESARSTLPLRESKAMVMHRAY